MKALKILNGLIGQVFLIDRWKRRPGEVVASLSEKERTELQNLSSEELVNQVTPNPAYWCDDYYKELEIKKELVAFDKKILK
jgi:hypothetical protein